MLNRKHIRQRFERIANQFDNADFVHKKTRKGLIERLGPVLFKASSILDLGSATGSASNELRSRFKRANIVSLDISHNMLCKAREKKSWFSKATYAQADAISLPFKNSCFDLVFANMLLPWLNDPQVVFQEITRVLRKGGVFAFTTLGPDSFREIARSWNEIDSKTHVNQFIDMHNLGDGLVNSGLRDPVVDVDRLLISYKNSETMINDLKNSGSRNVLETRNQTMTGKESFKKMIKTLTNPSTGEIKLSLELIYGHCWGFGEKIDVKNYRIDANQIPLRKK
jgi:malonyl-CoA O-methyltransferase